MNSLTSSLYYTQDYVSTGQYFTFIPQASVHAIQPPMLTNATHELVLVGNE